MGVLGVPSPTFVHGEARLPPARRWCGRDELFGCVEVASAGQAIVDEDPWLAVAQEGFDLVGAPPISRALPLPVEPDHVDAAVSGHQLVELSHQVLPEPCGLRF